MADISVRSEAEVVDAVRDARERRRTLEIVAAGTKRAFGRPMECDDVLDVSCLRGVVSYQPEELLLTALPGTPVAEIGELLAAKNQRLGFEPCDWGPLFGAHANAGTIGGAISADVCGPAAVRYGRARDQLLGFRAVNGFGEAYKAGGKVVKNVTGFDLPKLMCGAFGTLGVLTEVTLRVFPKPPISSTMEVSDLGETEGLALLRRVWSSALESTGLAYIPGRVVGALENLGTSGKGSCLFQLEGNSESLAAKRDMLWDILRGEGLHVAMEVPFGDTLFDKIGSGAAFVNSSCDVWRVTAPPHEAERIAGSMDNSLVLADWAGGLLWVGTDGGNTRIREIAARHGGAATLVRASEDARRRLAVFSPEAPARAVLTRAVKAAFDPLVIFNPGRMYDGV